MGQFGFGFGFALGQFLIGGGIIGTEIFNANVADFDGSSYLDAGDPSEFDSLTALSIAFNMKPDTTGSIGVLFGKFDPNQRSFRVLRLTNNVIEFSITSDGTTEQFVTSIAGVGVGEELGVIVEYTGTALNIYFDGVLNATAPATGTIFNGTASLLIGEDNNWYYSGLLWAPLFYDRVLTLEEKQALTVSPYRCLDLLVEDVPSLSSGLIYAPSLYNHTGFVGQELTDQSASGITTTNSGVTFTGSAQIECEPYPYQMFNANVASTSAGKYFQGSDWLRNQAEFSAFSWVYVTTTGSHQIISETSNLNTGSTRLQFRVDSSNKLSVFYRSAHGLNTVSIADTVDFPLNTWTFVGFSINCNTDEMALYKNGSQVVFDDSQNPVQCEDLPSATGVQLSSFGSAQEVMIGNHTQANLFRRVLTEAEFTSAYNSGVIRCYDLMVQETPSLADSAGSFSLANWAGNVGNEIVNQGSGDITMNNIGSVPFTGTADIECIEA